MNRFLTLMLGVLMIIGLLSALIQLYASSDGLQHPFAASLYYLGTSLIMISLIITFRIDINKKVMIANNIIISIFAMNSIVLALICLYSVEPQSRVESLASSIFFCAGMILSSSALFVRPKIKSATTISNKYEETNNLPCSETIAHDKRYHK